MPEIWVSTPHPHDSSPWSPAKLFATVRPRDISTLSSDYARTVSQYLFGGLQKVMERLSGYYSLVGPPIPASFQARPTPCCDAETSSSDRSTLVVHKGRACMRSTTSVRVHFMPFSRCEAKKNLNWINKEVGSLYPSL